MNLSKTKLLFLSGSLALVLFACSKHNPENVLNPESEAYDPAMAADADSNGIADALEPFWVTCGGDAKCAEQKARDAKNNTPESSEAPTSSAVKPSSSSAVGKSSAKPVSSTTDGSSVTLGSSTTPGSSVVPGSSTTPSSSVKASSSGSAPSSSSVIPDGYFKVTLVGGIIVGSGLTSGYFEKDTVLKIALAPFAGGLNLCKSGWSTDDVDGDFITDTISFAMPAKNVSFTGGSRTCPDTLTDGRDGQAYPYVTINSKKWLAGNANYNTTGDLDYCYNDLAANCDTLGRLYQYESALTACPNGWRLPTFTEISTNPENLDFDLAGRRSETGTFAYLDDAAQISYWFDTTGIAQSGETISGKGCDYETEDCDLIFTNTVGGNWGIGSIDLTKAYPIRCIQK